MKQSRFCRLVFSIIVGCAAAATGAKARPAVPPAIPSQEMNFTLEGKISKQAPGKLTLRGEGNIIFRVTYNDKTEIKRKDGGPGSPKDLQVGMTVRVEGDLTETGEVVAQRIQVLEEAAEK